MLRNRNKDKRRGLATIGVVTIVMAILNARLYLKGVFLFALLRAICKSYI